MQDRDDTRARRRHFLLGAGSTGTAAFTLGSCSSGPSTAAQGQAPAKATGAAPTGSIPTATPTAGSGACALTPELTAGPYYLAGPLIRRDITEGRPGLPFDLHLTVIDSTTCRPLASAAVDVWHCDADGQYSGFNGNTLAETEANGRNDKRYLRGVQLTGADGTASFSTIYPGWYEGRAIHIHLEVRVGGTAGASYAGGHVAHVGQLFFDDTISNRVMKLPAYAVRGATRTTNAEDSIFLQGGAASIVELAPAGDDLSAKGLAGRITLSVNPGATPPSAPMF